MTLTEPVRYRLHYLADGDDMDPTFFVSARPVQPGEAIELPETGYFHWVCRLRPQKTGTRLDLSKSASSAQEALALAIDYQHWPPA